MAAYWLSFRLESDNTYSERYDALVEAVRLQSSKWWLETSSFFVFESANGIDSVASKVKAAINPSKNIILLGMPDYKAARLIGASTDEDILSLMPFIKKV